MPTERTPEKEKMNKERRENSQDRRQTMIIQKKDEDEEDGNCGRCTKFVAKGIKCDECFKWFHAKCEKMKQEEMNFLSNVEDTTCLWICEGCKRQRDVQKEMVIELKKENEIMRKKINEKTRPGKENEQIMQLAKDNETLKKENLQLKELNKNLTEKVNEIGKEVKKIAKGSEVTQTNQVKDMTDFFKQLMNTFTEQAKQDRELMREEFKIMITEQRQEMRSYRSEIVDELRDEMKEEEARKEKQKRLVMFNINEPRGEGREQDQEEMEKVVEVIREGIGIEKPAIKNIGRIGTKQNGKNRPMLVELESVEKKWEIVKNAKNLKDARIANMNKVVIVPDLTWKQREKDKELRNRLQEKRQQGERGWYIRRGELMRGETRERNNSAPRFQGA